MARLNRRRIGEKVLSARAESMMGKVRSLRPQSAEVALGTSTPGYWQNHTDVWPVFGDQMIIGDWTHDTVCSGGEVCLALSLDEAAAALSQPARGDASWILGRALITAWLNVSSGNDASCIEQTIDDATAWLLVEPSVTESSATGTTTTTTTFPG